MAEAVSVVWPTATPTSLTVAELKPAGIVTGMEDCSPSSPPFSNNTPPFALAIVNVRALVAGLGIEKVTGPWRFWPMEVWLIVTGVPILTGLIKIGKFALAVWPLPESVTVTARV